MSVNGVGSQPCFAMAYVPPGQTASTYTPNVMGGSCIKNSTAAAGFTFAFDVPIAAAKYVVVATPVAANAAAGISAIVVTPVGVNQFIVICVDDAHVAIDCGLMIAVFEIPDRD